MPSSRPATDPRPTLVLIDDDDMVRRALVRSLRRKYAIIEHREAETVLAQIASGARFDAIICDLNLGGMSGRTFVLAVKRAAAAQAARIVILSGSARDELDVELQSVLDDRFVEKPASASELDVILGTVIATHARAA